MCLRERGRWTRDATIVETVCAVASLGFYGLPTNDCRGSPKALGGVGKRLHRVRDISLGEDDCRVRTREALRILTVICDAPRSLKRSEGVAKVAAFLGDYAVRPEKAVNLVISDAPSWPLSIARSPVVRVDHEVTANRYPSGS